MTAEKPPRAQLEISNTKQLPLSAETAVASAVVAQKVGEGKIPEKGELDTLVTSVADDLKKDGVHISKEDISSISKELGEKISPAKKGKPETPMPELPNIDFGTYLHTLSDVEKTYALQKGKWWTISGLAGGLTAGSNVLEGARVKAISDKDWYEPMAQKIKDVFDWTQLSSTVVQNLGDIKKWYSDSWKPEDPQDKRGYIRELFKATWPAWSWVVQKIAEVSISRVAETLYFKERGRLQDMVNTRVAASLVWSDFAKFHDRSSGEMMSIINRGKQATVDLVTTTYFELVPHIFRALGYAGGQAFLGKFEGASAVAKLGLAGWATFRGAKEKQLQNAQELMIWDKINNELVTTLSNLETIRTAGRPEEEAGILKGVMADIDYVAAGGLRQQMQRDRIVNILFDVLDLGIPGVKIGKELRKDIKESGGILFRDLLEVGWELGNKARFMKGESDAMRGSLFQIAQLYQERIIPYVQDIQRMEELLGPYEALDHPDSPAEKQRVGADTLPSYDISIADLSYKNILQHVNIEVPQGSFTAIKGPSGIGKTTLLRQLVGLYAPESGTMKIGGVPVENIKKFGDTSLVNNLGYAGQSADLLEGWTLRENMLLGTTNIPPEHLVSVMHELGLDHLKDRLDTSVKHYSGGEKRRIGIARALLKNPKILILDEPTAHLDAKSTQQVLEIIQALRKKKPEMTVLAITHDPVFEGIAEQVIDFAEVNKKPPLADNQMYSATAKP